MYNPFGKALNAMTPEDLQSLKGKPEGWHLEYKRTVPNPPSLAKSVSSFANHEGGWLILGAYVRV